MADKVGMYLTGLLVLGCFSYLFRENRFYTYIEHVYVGFAAAQAMVLGWGNIADGGLRPLGEGRFSFLIPLALGALLYMRFSQRNGYMTRLPMSFMMGVAAATSITGALEAQLVKQVRATILPLTSFNNVVVVLGTVSTVAFFLFIPTRKAVKKTKDPLALLGTVGRATVMVAFGSSYGYTVMARLSYLVSRLQFLFGEWIPIIPH